MKLRPERTNSEHMRHVALVPNKGLTDSDEASEHALDGHPSNVCLAHHMKRRTQ